MPHFQNLALVQYKLVVTRNSQYKMKIRGLNNDSSQGMHPLMNLGHMFLAANFHPH
jgi:hypothetical protein